MPSVPTMTEAGIVSYEVYEWNALFAPAATPNIILQKLTDGISKVTQSTEFVEKVNSLGGEVFQGNAEVADVFIKTQMTQWANCLRVARLQLINLATLEIADKAYQALRISCFKFLCWNSLWKFR